MTGDSFAVLREGMRRLWSAHVDWTRAYIVAAVANDPSASAAATRLMRNQEDIGNAIEPNPPLMLFPTDNRYAVIQACGTNANRLVHDGGVPGFADAGYLITWLRELEGAGDFTFHSGLCVASSMATTSLLSCRVTKAIVDWASKAI